MNCNNLPPSRMDTCFDDVDTWETEHNLFSANSDVSIDLRIANCKVDAESYKPRGQTLVKLDDRVLIEILRVCLVRGFIEVRANISEDSNLFFKSYDDKLVPVHAVNLVPKDLYHDDDGESEITRTEVARIVLGTNLELKQPWFACETLEMYGDSKLVATPVKKSTTKKKAAKKKVSKKK